MSSKGMVWVHGEEMSAIMCRSGKNFGYESVHVRYD